MYKKRTPESEYLKMVILAHLLNNTNEGLKHTSAYKHNLKNKVNLMLKEVMPEARKFLSISSGNRQLASETEKALGDAITSLSFLSFEELVNVDRVVRQHLLDEHNLVIRIGWKKYTRKAAEFIAKVWVYISQPFYWLRSKVEKLIAKLK